MNESVSVILYFKDSDHAEKYNGVNEIYVKNGEILVVSLIGGKSFYFPVSRLESAHEYINSKNWQGIESKDHEYLIMRIIKKGQNIDECGRYCSSFYVKNKRLLIVSDENGLNHYYLLDDIDKFYQEERAVGGVFLDTENYSIKTSGGIFFDKDSLSKISEDVVRTVSEQCKQRGVSKREIINE